MKGDFDEIHGLLLYYYFYFFTRKAHSDFQLDAKGGKQPAGKCNVHCYIKDKKTRERSLSACSSSPIQNSSKMCQGNKTPGKPLGAHDTIHT